MKWVWFCLFFAISAWAAEGDTVYIDVVKRDTVYIDVPQKIDTVYYDPAEDIPKEGSSSSTNASLHTVYLHYDLGSLLATAVCESPILVAQVEFALGRRHSLMVPASFLKISPNSKFVSSFDSDDYSGSVYQFTLGLAYRYYTTEKKFAGYWNLEAQYVQRHADYAHEAYNYYGEQNEFYGSDDATYRGLQLAIRKGWTTRGSVNLGIEFGLAYNFVEDFQYAILDDSMLYMTDDLQLELRLNLGMGAF
ncbi:hypothetical protein [Hallerella succinigenes]|uniref:hypothetical protein n=1 Tax=Hallerella succinigenes TaxID=1896222 RepID=UPI002A831B6D|nr:hypothetical protein [Hallerella succinigenes]MDY5029774.1 hypothetical protein [Hallerella succinigenes]